MAAGRPCRGELCSVSPGRGGELFPRSLVRLGDIALGLSSRDSGEALAHWEHQCEKDCAKPEWGEPCSPDRKGCLVPQSSLGRLLGAQSGAAVCTAAFPVCVTVDANGSDKFGVQRPESYLDWSHGLGRTSASPAQ